MEGIDPGAHRRHRGREADHPGQLLAAGRRPTFTVADLSTMWVHGQRLRRDLELVGAGQSASIVTDARTRPVRAASTTWRRSSIPAPRRRRAHRRRQSRPGCSSATCSCACKSIRRVARTGHPGSRGRAAARRRQPAVRVRRRRRRHRSRAGGMHVRLSRRRPVRGHGRASPPATRSWPTARSSSSSRRASDRSHAASSIERGERSRRRAINRIVRAALGQPFLVVIFALTLDRRRRLVVLAAAGGRLPRPLAADGRDHHAVAGPRRRRGGAAGHGADRDAR